MTPRAGPQRLPSWALAGLIAAFVSTTYLFTVKRVNVVDELEAELQRELELEARRQSRADTKGRS